MPSIEELENLDRAGLAALKRLPVNVRRRNRRLLWIISIVAVLSAVWTPWAVHHGWVQPEEATYAFPHWMK